MAEKLELILKELDFDVVKGKAYRLRMTYANKQTGLPFDLTSHKARFVARLSAGHADTIVSLDETDGITLGSSTNNIEIIVPGINVDASEIRYGFELEDAATVITPMLTGDITLIKSLI
ncbi:MAG: hypothetical protein COA83_09630 [Methylophaga sp.]|nr:MAG: hypothetical protein COA83_09630 [Methylophaga sp.]